MELSTTTTKKGRINILADGEYRFTVPAFIWYRSPLLGQAQAEEDALEALRLEGLFADAEDKALTLLSNRAHSERELEQKLRTKYPADVVAGTLISLREKGLVDDALFAGSYAEELARRRAYAPDRIFSELLRKGIDREIAENAVNALELDKNTGIIKIINKMHLPEHPTKKDADRLIRRLLAAGYSMGDIREVVSFSYEDERNRYE